MKLKILLVVLVLFLNIRVTSALLENEDISTIMPDGTDITTLPPFTEGTSFNITDMIAQMKNNNENLNNIVYKIIVPNRNDNQWNTPVDFSESKMWASLTPVVYNDKITRIFVRIERGNGYAWVCCNVTVNDRLYTADGTANSSLRGTLTNMYNLNYKARYPYDNGTFRNLFIGASIVPDVFNRRAAFGNDGTQIAFALETKNVTVSGTPELMRVFFI